MSYWRGAGAFCKAVASLTVKQPDAAPAQLHGKPLGARGIAAGDVPTLAQLGLQPLHSIPGCSPRCRGGQSPASLASYHVA